MSCPFLCCCLLPAACWMSCPADDQFFVLACRTNCVIFSIMITSVVLLSIYVQMKNNDNAWLVLLWRVMLVLLPLILIARTLASIQHWRSGQQARDHHTEAV